MQKEPILKEILDELRRVRTELQALRTEVAELREFRSVHPFEALSLDAVVGKDYVAWRFGCSVRAVRAGEKSTDKIKRFSQKPLKFFKSDVDAVFRKLKTLPKEKAGKLRESARVVKRKSIIKK